MLHVVSHAMIFESVGPRPEEIFHAPLDAVEKAIPETDVRLYRSRTVDASNVSAMGIAERAWCHTSDGVIVVHEPKVLPAQTASTLGRKRLVAHTRLTERIETVHAVPLRQQMRRCHNA